LKGFSRGTYLTGPFDTKPLRKLRLIASLCSPFVEKLGTQNSGVIHPRRVGGLKLSGCPALVKQAVDQTFDPVSGLSSIQSAKRRDSRSVVVQLRVGASNYSFQECRAVISSTEAEEQVYASRDKFNPAHEEISAPNA
jgi:hypothetical protein